MENISVLAGCRSSDIEMLNKRMKTKRRIIRGNTKDMEGTGTRVDLIARNTGGLESVDLDVIYSNYNFTAFPYCSKMFLLWSRITRISMNGKTDYPE